MQVICPGWLGLAQTWRTPAGSAGECGLVMNRGAAGLGEDAAVCAALRAPVVWAERAADADWEEADAVPGGVVMNRGAAGPGEDAAVCAALRAPVVWAERAADADWEKADTAPGAAALRPNSARAATATSDTGRRRDEGVRKGAPDTFRGAPSSRAAARLWP
jgi:hypothetical protein